MERIQKVRILLIEDNPPRLQALHEMFAHPRAMVVAAISAGTAIRTLKKEGFDLILLDHDLHESHPMGAAARYQSGTQVVDALLASQVNRRTPVRIHSMNEAKRQSMHDRLTANQFDVEIIPMDTWTRSMAQALVEELVEELDD